MPLDAHWLFEFDTHLFDAFGQRMDTAGLPRWSNPDAGRLRDGNHAAVRAGDGLIPDQLVQVFDAQRRDGANRRCVDVYGPQDERDALCTELGLYRQPEAGAQLLMFQREGTAPHPASSTDARPAPPVTEIERREWVDTIATLRGDAFAAWARDHAMIEAAVEEAHFYAIRIGDNPVTCIARFDWPDRSQIASLYTDPDFRKTGFGRAALNHAIHAAPSRRVYGVVDGDNLPMLKLARRSSVDVVLTDARRRYVGKWD